MPDVGQAQSTPVPLFTLKQVGANVWAAIDNPAAKGVAAANGGFVIGDDGVAVIDSFASANAAKELLTEDGDKVKVSVFFRGREMSHPELGMQLLRKVAETLKEDAKLEKPPMAEGRALTMVLVPANPKFVPAPAASLEQATEA